MWAPVRTESKARLAVRHDNLDETFLGQTASGLPQLAEVLIDLNTVLLVESDVD